MVIVKDTPHTHVRVDEIPADHIVMFKCKTNIQCMAVYVLTCLPKSHIWCFRDTSSQSGNTFFNDDQLDCVREALRNGHNVVAVPRDDFTYGMESLFDGLYSEMIDK